MTELPSHLRFPAWHSLRRRLPVLISALIAAILITFLWAAYLQVEAALVKAGAERLQSASGQIANLLDRQTALDQVRRAAGDDQFRAFLRAPSHATREAARLRLQEMSAGSPRRLELWDDNGRRVLEVSVAGAADTQRAGKTVPPRPRPTQAGIGPFDETAGLVYHDAVAEVLDDPASASRRLGFFVIATVLSVTPPDIVRKLVGTDAAVIVGARGGQTWTDLAGAVPPPPVDMARDGLAEYRGADGRARIGALNSIPASPWVAWVEMPKDVFRAPANNFLALMIPIALIFLAGGVIGARMLSLRITKPLFALSAAAGRVALGDYSQRVPVGRRDEVGRLAEAFNSMTAEIAESRKDLERRVLERTQELAAARQEADRANRAKSEFLSLMSHDLRTPLNAVLGFGQLLENDALTPEQAEHVAQILSAGRHLLDLISDVLDITRIESGQLSLSREPVAVHEIVQSAIDLLKPMAIERRVRLDVEALAVDDAVMADRQRLTQVLINLMANAVKYNREGGRVSVRGGRIGADFYRISISDTGRGIPEAQMRKLFVPFERLGAEQGGVEGTGLGLALSRALAEAMGGSIGVTSVPGAGSTFWVDLAVADLPAGPSVHPEPRHVIDTRTVPAAVVLYVEDNRSNVRLVERILQRRPGIELVHAPTGEAGIRLARARRPDLVLLDLHLPDMGGEEVLRTLAAEPATRDIPKIVVTADAGGHLARRLEAEGAVGYLTKPLNIADMLRKIDEVLDRRGHHV